MDGESAALTFCITLELPFSLSSSQQKSSEFRAKKYFTGHRTANGMQSVVAMKGDWSGLLFFWTSCREGEFPRDYLVNVASCLLAYH